MAADACAAPPSELSNLLNCLHGFAQHFALMLHTIVVLLHLEVEISELFAINEGGSGPSLNLSNIPFRFLITFLKALWFSNDL